MEIIVRDPCHSVPFPSTPPTLVLFVLRPCVHLLGRVQDSDIATALRGFPGRDTP